MYDAFIIIHLHIHRQLLRVPSVVKTGLTKKVLRTFLSVDHQSRRQFIAKYGLGLYDGCHPKNVFNTRRDFFLEALNSDEVILDIACGSGTLLAALSPRIKFGVGIELSDENMKLCERIKSENLTFVQADLYKIDLQKLIDEKNITTVTLSHILEHVEDVVGLLQRFRARRLLICVPSKENWMCGLKENLGVEIFTDPTHFREYTREMLKHELKASNYAVRTMSFNGEGEIVCDAYRLESQQKR